MPRHRSRRFAVAALAAAGVALASAAAPAGAITRTTAITRAAAYATAHGYYAGVAVLDTRTGGLYSAGHAGSTFISASVIKVLIAARLLLAGRMHGDTETVAYRMITQSDNAAAQQLYPQAGADALVPWLAQHYGVTDLGSPPPVPGDWGLTGLVPRGLVQLYAKLKADARVGPWLLDAMHHIRARSAAGEYQLWGLPSATTHAAVKQGWNLWAGAANVNTTGFVNGDRYAVAILTRGPTSSYLTAITQMITHAARLLLPGGWFPDAVPSVTSLSRTAFPVTGGWRLVVRGTAFTGVQRVLVGGVAGSDVVVTSSARLIVTVPAHPAGWTGVRVVTSHGTSPTTRADHLEFVAAPAVTAVQPGAGSRLGGTTLTITGTSFRQVTSVLVGGQPATSVTVAGPTSLTAVAPAHGPGTVDIRVVTAFGTSPLVPADDYAYN